MDTSARLFRERGLLSTLDLLAEDIRVEEACAANIATYLRMIDDAADDPRFVDSATRPTVSLKLSSYTTQPLDKGGDGRGSLEALSHICEHAKRRGIGVT